MLSQLRDHIAGQQFQMLHFVKDWIQQKMSRACAHEFAELVGALRAIAPDGDARSHVGILVARTKSVAQPALCARPVVIDRQVDQLGDYELVGVAPLFVQETPQQFALFDEVGG